MKGPRTSSRVFVIVLTTYEDNAWTLCTIAVPCTSRNIQTINRRKPFYCIQLVYQLLNIPPKYLSPALCAWAIPLFASRSKKILLLVNPRLLGASPGDDLLWLEPKLDLMLGRVDGVGAVADVAADINGVVEADGAWGRVDWVGGAEDEAANLYGFTAFPDHGNDGARGHV
jgi:hypothetical protein